MKKTNLFVVLMVALTLFAFGCKNSQDGQNDVARRFTQEDLQKTKEEIKNAKEQGGKPYVLLVQTSDTCDTQTYKDLALQNTSGTDTLALEKVLGSYTVLNLLMTDTNFQTLDLESDNCLEMAFPRTSRKSLNEMRKLLTEGMYEDFQEKGFDQSTYDLPTDCEELKSSLEGQLSDEEIENAYQKCLDREAYKEDWQAYFEDLKNYYDSSQTTQYVCAETGYSAPAISGCTEVSTSQYPQYSMNYVTPDDPVVKEFASKYSDINSLYGAVQEMHWQSDDTIYGCPDYFAKPADYLSKTPDYNSNFMCGTDTAGDCDDQNLALSSLIIASGMYPADRVRVAMGMVNFGGGSIGGHLWQEICLDNTNGDGCHWVPVDGVMGSTCYDDGECYIYTAEELQSWGYTYDYYNYVDYPVIDYWGVANNKYYCNEDNGWECSSGTPENWKQGAKTAYQS